MVPRFALLTLFVLLLSACAAQGAPTALPTQPLPPTVTPSPLPPTDVGLERPSDLVTATPAESTQIADPVAAELIALARRQVARVYNVPEADVRLIDVVSTSWPDTGLGCPQPGASYAAGHHDGYRIVVGAGDTTYIFHTDFDHVVECAAADEVLPTTEVATPEATPA